MDVFSTRTEKDGFTGFFIRRKWNFGENRSPYGGYFTHFECGVCSFRWWNRFMEKILTKQRGHHNSDYPLRISYLMKDQTEHSLQGRFWFFGSVEFLLPWSEKQFAGTMKGESACPPIPPLSLAMMTYYQFRVYRIGGATAAGVKPPWAFSL